MEDYITAAEEMSLPELVHTIKNVLAKIDDPNCLESITSAIVVYMQRIQEENNMSIIFPLELLPAQKAEIKKWGFIYAFVAVKQQGVLKSYQQDGCLCYTRFQPLSPAQWEAIREGEIDDLVTYYMEMRDKGVSPVDIPPEYKIIIDTYRNEYNLESKELHDHLRSTSSKRLGCMVNLFFFSIVSAAIAWITIH